MAVAEELKVVVKAEVDKAIRDMQKFDKSLDNTGKSAKGMGLKMAGVAAAVGVSVMAIRKAVQIGKQLIDAYARQEQAEARLAAVIRATGEAAGYTSDEMIEMAKGFQDVTTFGDEAIIEMQSIIATFRSIQGDVFERTTELALDLSAAFGQDLKSSAIQLGKALEDPQTGLTALRRIGVSFTEEQKEMIKAMQEAGDVAGAQGAILEVLEQQVGGVARAMADTATGEIEQFKNKFGDLKEAIGLTLTESVQPLISGLNRLVDNMIESVNAAREMRKGVQEYEEGLDTLLAYEAEMRQIDRQLAALPQAASRGVDTSEREVQLTARRLELEELIRSTKQQELETEQRLNEEREEAARIAAEEEEAARRQLALEMQYAEYRADILGVLESAKTEADRLREQIDYISSFGWAEGSLLEEDRLEALRILRERLAELTVVTEDLNRAVKDGSKTGKGGPGPTYLGNLDPVELTKTQRFLAQLSEDQVDSEKRKQAIIQQLMDDQERIRLLLIEQGNVTEEMLTTDRNREKVAMKLNEIEDARVEIYDKQQRRLDEQAEALREQRDTVLDIAGAFVDAEMQADKFIVSLLRMVPVVGPLMGGVMEGVMSIGEWLSRELSWSWDPENGWRRTAEIEEEEQRLREEEQRLREEELEAREEFLDQLRDTLGLEADVQRDLWERNLLTTEQFLDEMDGLSEVLEFTSGLFRNRGIDRRSSPEGALPYSSAAGGANFVTNGPQLMMVGDNASGREHVMVNPNPGSPMGITVNLNGPVYGFDDFGQQAYEAIEHAKARGAIA